MEKNTPFTPLRWKQVEEVFQDWVHEDADGYKMLTVRGLAPLVAEALREVSDNAMEQEAKIAELCDRNSQLESRLRDLEALVAELAANQTKRDTE